MSKTILDLVLVGLDSPKILHLHNFNWIFLEALIVAAPDNQRWDD